MRSMGRNLYFQRAGQALSALVTVTLSAGAALAGPGGELDPTFGDNGLVRFGTGMSAEAIVQQPTDGKLVVAGNRFGPGESRDLAVLRLNLDGSLDDTFGSDGVTTIDFFGYVLDVAALASRPDRKIIVAGAVYSPILAPRFAFTRLNPNGALDTTFGDGGRVMLPMPGKGGSVADVVLGEDGSLVVLGAVFNHDTDFAFFRLDANGALDTTFGTGATPGFTVVDTGTWNHPSALIRQPDGKYVACGTLGNGWEPPSQMLAIRVNSDGSLDGGFGTGGVWYLEGATESDLSSANDCLSMPDGSLVLAGSRAGIALARLRPDGVLDTAYWNSGITRIDLDGDSEVRSIVLLDSGGLSIVGIANGPAVTGAGGALYPVADAFFAQIDPETGLLDPDFGDRGVTVADFGHGDLAAQAELGALIRQADGKLVAAGHVWSYPAWPVPEWWDSNYELSSIALARVDPSGAGNVGFVGFAEAIMSVPEYARELVATVRRTGGGSGPLLVDFDTLAMTAASPGDYTASSGTLVWASGDMAPKQIAVPIVDDTVGEPEERFQIVLSNTTGALAGSAATVWIADNEPPPALTFGGAGAIGAASGNTGGGGAVGLIEWLLLAGAGLLAKRSNARGIAVRHRTLGRQSLCRFGRRISALLTVALSAAAALAGPGGELDPTFGNNGLLRLGAGLYGAAIAQQPTDGKLVVAGGYPRSDGWNDFAVIRINPDGSLDATFSHDGVATIEFAGTGNRVAALALLPDGRIIVAGEAYPQNVINAASEFVFARLNPDGTLDGTFGSGGRVTLHLPRLIGSLSRILPLANGRLLVSGTVLNRDDDIVLLQLNAAGALDTTFGAGSIPGVTIVDSGLWDAPAALIRQPDGRYVICGQRYGGWDPPWQMLAVRVNPNGSLDGSFGSGGVWYREGDTPYDDSAADDCLSMSDGSLVLAGARAGGAALARLRPDGVLDTAYWNSGVTTIDVGEYSQIGSIVQLRDGRLGVAGRANGGAVRWGDTNYSVSDLFFASIDPQTGLLDTGFGDRGVTIADFGSPDRLTQATLGGMIQQADGKVIAVGKIWSHDPFDLEWSSDDYGRLSAIVLARVDPHGTGNVGFAGFAEPFMTVAEDDAELVATVRRTGGGTGVLLVDFDTLGMTAVAPGDFTVSSGTLVWPSGDMAPKQITVPIVKDSFDESPERFQIVLSTTSGALASSRATISISEGGVVPAVNPNPGGGVAPAVNSSGTAGSGGGAVGIEWLLLLASAGFVARRSTDRSC